jgi:hypothetical protein
MKSAVAVLSVLLFASLVSAQDKPPAPAGSPQDTVLQAPDREGGPMCNHEKWGTMRERGHKIDGCPAMMERHPMWGPRFMQCPLGYRCFGHHGLFKLLLLGILLLNILLTIIVSLDMARSGRFNGLWIPVLLLAGIPGSAIYALFRIGDRIQCKQGQG